MSFIPEQPKKKSIVDRYIKLVTGIPVTVQILDNSATPVHRHWIKTSDKPKGFPINCLGYNSCPICLRNRSLGEKPQDNPLYIAFQRRYMVNVIDLTLCVKSSHTQEIFYGIPNSEGILQFPKQDGEGHSLLDVTPTPRMEVMILERGPDLFEKKFRPLDNRVKHEGKALHITEFPIELVAEGAGRDMVVTVFPLPGDPRTVDISKYQESKFDLNGGLRFNAEEVSAMMTGTALSDILAARNAAEQLGGLNLEDSPPF